MSFGDYIDFKSILDDLYLENVECGYVFKNKNDNYYQVCDQKITSKYKKPYNEMIFDALDTEYAQHDHNYLQKHLNDTQIKWEIYDEKYYESDNYLLCYFEIGNDEESTGVALICLISLKEKKFMVVGTTGHPFVTTSTFQYNNSDGSGPDFKFGTTPKDLLDALEKYYDSFCNNKYH